MKQCLCIYLRFSKTNKELFQVKLILEMKRLRKSRSFYVSVQPLHNRLLVIPNKSIELMAIREEINYAKILIPDQ